MRRFWNRRVAGPVMALLRQGLTPEGVSLSLAFGVAAGLFPVIGATTMLGLLLGVVLRLNVPALQLANWLAYPLQIALIIPLVRLGEWLVGAPPVTFSVVQVVASMSADPVGTLGRYGMTGLHGILGWLAVLPIVILVLYRLLLPALRAARRRMRPLESGDPAPSGRGPTASEVS
jgi:uncharacterized protein (DUF2062 family)